MADFNLHSKSMCTDMLHERAVATPAEQSTQLSLGQLATGPTFAVLKGQDGQFLLEVTNTLSPELKCSHHTLKMFVKLFP